MRLANSVFEGEAFRAPDVDALTFDQVESVWTAGSDAVSLDQREVLFTTGSCADSVDQLVVPWAVLNASGGGHVESRVADVLFALSIDQFEVGRADDLLADAINVVVAGRAFDSDADSVLSLLTKLALGIDALAVDEQVVCWARNPDALSFSQLEAISAAHSEARSVGLSLEESSAHRSAGIIEELKSGPTVNEDALAFFEDHAAVALGSDAGLLVSIPLETSIAAHRVAFLVLEGFAIRTGDSDAISFDQVEVLGAADGFAGSLEEDLTGRAGFSADAQAAYGLSVEAFRTLLVDAGGSIPDKSLSFVTPGDALRASDFVAFRTADLNTVSSGILLVANWAADRPAVSISEGETCRAGSELADALIIDGLMFGAFDLVADVSSSDLSRSAGDLLANSVDQLETASAANRNALVVDESGTSRALIGSDNCFGCHRFDAVSIDLLESRRAAKNNDSFSLFADEAVLLPSSRAVLDALDVLVVVVASRT